MSDRLNAVCWNVGKAVAITLFCLPLYHGADWRLAVLLHLGVLTLWLLVEWYFSAWDNFDMVALGVVLALFVDIVAASFSRRAQPRGTPPRKQGTSAPVVASAPDSRPECGAVPKPRIA